LRASRKSRGPGRVVSTWADDDVGQATDDVDGPRCPRSPRGKSPPTARSDGADRQGRSRAAFSVGCTRNEHVACIRPYADSRLHEALVITQCPHTLNGAQCTLEWGMAARMSSPGIRFRCRRPTLAHPWQPSRRSRVFMRSGPVSRASDVCSSSSRRLSCLRSGSTSCVRRSLHNRRHQMCRGAIGCGRHTRSRDRNGNGQVLVQLGRPQE
jgi:hypothetical protein